jgi:hypothetical protein
MGELRRGGPGNSSRSAGRLAGIARKEKSSPPIFLVSFVSKPAKHEKGK